MSVLLTDDELKELSGLTQGAAQARYLRCAFGLNVPRRPDGRVRVTWDVINQAMRQTKPQAATTGPRWTK